MSPSPFHLPKSKSFARSMCMNSSFYTRHLIYFPVSPLWTSYVSCSTDKCISTDLSYQLFNSIPQKQSCNLDNKKGQEVFIQLGRGILHYYWVNIIYSYTKLQKIGHTSVKLYSMLFKNQRVIGSNRLRLITLHQIKKKETSPKLGQWPLVPYFRSHRKAPSKCSISPQKSTPNI